MTEQDLNPVAWISLASTSGLSLVSLGHPGLRSVDEQVYTGGLTAVQQMLGGEVGGDTARFVGGSHSNKTGRFLVKAKGSEYELVGQFLLISPAHIAVAPVLIDFYESMVTFFAEETLKTDLVERAEKEFTAFAISDVLEYFLSSISKARKKVSIPSNDKLFGQALQESLEKSINDYEYSSTLVKISGMKGKYRDTVQKVNSERKELLNSFTDELLEFLASEFPHSLVMFSKTGSITKELRKYVNSHLNSFPFSDHLQDVIKGFESNDLQRFLEDYSLHEVTKKNLGVRLEEEIFHKYIQEFPLLFLASPEIDTFDTEIETLTFRINERYDLGGTLSRIASNMIEKDSNVKLVIPYIRHFCDEFSAGLTPSAWKYMQIIFRVISLETKIELTNILPSMKDQIPPSHFSSIEKMMTKYKLTKLAPLSFTVKKASDVLPFYRALFSSLAFGVNTVISDIAFGEDNPNNLLVTLADNLTTFAREIHQTYALFNIYAHLENVESKSLFSFGYPTQKTFKENLQNNMLNPEIFIQSFTEANEKHLQDENQLIGRKISLFRKEFDSEMKEILRFLAKNPSDISKGYSVKIAKNHSFNFPSKLLADASSIVTKTLEEYVKIIEQIRNELKKSQEAAKQFMDKKIKEKDLKNTLNNHSFITKSENNFTKLLDRTESEINKKYKDVNSIINKQVKNVSKGVSKQYTQSCTFLNINRKNLTKPENELVPDSSKLIKEIQNTIKQNFRKEEFFELINVGRYYFYAINRSLPNSLQSDVSRALVTKKNFPMLKEAIDKLPPTSTIFRSYSKVLEQHAHALLSTVFSSSGKLLGKNVLKSDPEVTIVQHNNMPIPALELGYLINERAAKSLQILLGDRVIIQKEKTEGKIINKVFAVVPSFNCDFSTMKHFWEVKDWTLSKTILTLSWFSLLAKNEFYLNLLRYSSELYSTRVKISLNNIFDQIGKGIA
ncbi:MAG: hypothetical protein ACTSQ9_01400 [Candidatus Hodarchaeales archaeon]